jgi:Outer membrane protein
MRKILCICLFFSFAEIIFAQRSESTDRLSDINVERLLPPVTLLVDSILKRSPQVLMAEKNKEELAVNLAQTKRDWMQYLTFSTNYQRRKGGSLGVSQDNSSGLSTAIYTDQSYSQYAAGLSLGFSLSSIYERKSRIKMAQIKVESSHATIQNLKDDLALKVYDAYSDLVKNLTLLESLSDTKESYYIQVLKNDRDYLNNQIKLDVLTKTKKEYNESVKEFEEVKSECRKLVYTLERLTGVELMTRLKGRL